MKKIYANVLPNSLIRSNFYLRPRPRDAFECDDLEYVRCGAPLFGRAVVAFFCDVGVAFGFVLLGCFAIGSLRESFKLRFSVSISVSVRNRHCPMGSLPNEIFIMRTRLSLVTS